VSGDWTTLIERAARFVAADFPGVEAEDLRQDLWVIVLEKGLDPEHHGAASLLEKIAKHKAWEYRKDHLYDTSQYDYRQSDVRELLETTFQRDAWQGAWAPADAASEDRMQGFEMRADIKIAWEKLPESYKKVIFMRYALGDTLPNNERVRLTRAIDRLTEILNFYQTEPEEFVMLGHPGTRRARNNATSAAYISKTYDES
jgi:DNA-directed RNA polymerase specialized sigma24 family protein